MVGWSLSFFSAIHALIFADLYIPCRESFASYVLSLFLKKCCADWCCMVLYISEQVMADAIPPWGHCFLLLEITLHVWRSNDFYMFGEVTIFTCLEK